jgi:hypothetical protein
VRGLKLVDQLRIRVARRPLAVWYAPEYRLPISGVEAAVDRSRFALDQTGAGDRLCLHGWAGGEEHLLIEVVLEKRRIAGADALYIHWLSLRNPRARFSEVRPRLPGQDVPGLGLASETVKLLTIMARRLGLAAVVYDARADAVAGACDRARFTLAQ